MGELVSFRRRASAPCHATEVGPGGAEILFFLGVRYERYIEPRDTLDTKGPKKRGDGAGKTPGRRKRRA
jgi:hypothetical protein